MPEARNRRTARDYERVWRERCVDRNLQDDWLEALNDLQVFDLISICEGHVAADNKSPKSRPHINLRLRSPLAPRAVSIWPTLSADLGHAMLSMFNVQDSSVTLELKQEVRLIRGGPKAHQGLTVRINACFPRSGPDLDPQTSAWFARAVRSIEQLDRLTMARLHLEGEAS